LILPQENIGIRLTNQFDRTNQTINPMRNIYEQKELVMIILPSQYIIIFNSN